ncbi:hypothetical protein ERO13_A10G189550v2 [Gossypium hirsutum]|nr:hypothetical protein ERO13_A10G189550v2 [Gossypium hirsutum]
MASNVKASTALLFSLNLFFLALVSSYNVDNNSNGSFYTKKSRNPVVIRPGYKFPNDGSTHSYYSTCNPLNLGKCLNLLGADLESAICLCTAIRANVLDIKLNLPISLSLLLKNCGRRVATEYICAP